LIDDNILASAGKDNRILLWDLNKIDQLEGDDNLFAVLEPEKII